MGSPLSHPYERGGRRGRHFFAFLNCIGRGGERRCLLNSDASNANTIRGGGRASCTLIVRESLRREVVGSLILPPPASRLPLLLMRVLAPTSLGRMPWDSCSFRVHFAFVSRSSCYIVMTVLTRWWGWNGGMNHLLACAGGYAGLTSLRKMRSMSAVYLRASRHRRQPKAQTLEGCEELAARSSSLGYVKWVFSSLAYSIGN